jgi:hypothetical protein
MNRALRLAASAVAAEPVASFDYRNLTDLHFALRSADEAVQMARATPRRADLSELVSLRDAAVAEALANLRKVLS